ncbi:Os01g0916350 [Oryza sativa Japonica Group]|uniref:Os01g0916350 protein n=1 Tax=Oryza sativa subsp. japonica TaxID=39947 RepID=A0A0P0VC30_ORYSJ|nr:hypothetical protein EE612_007552 [Oryza sativa]BAS75888.1 Os01g0916350 [Oryza sativa Japonica Group]
MLPNEPWSECSRYYGDLLPSKLHIDHSKHTVLVTVNTQDESTPECMQILQDLYIHISEVQSPPGYLISWAKEGPSGSAPKSTKKLGLIDSPPFSVSTSICNMWEPFLTRSWP